MSEPTCTMSKDGLHKKKVWQDKDGGKSGLSCGLCHRTWYHTLEGDIPTWDFLGLMNDKVQVSGSGAGESPSDMPQGGEGRTNAGGQGPSVSGTDGPHAPLSVTGGEGSPIPVQPDTDELGSGAVDTGPGDGSGTEDRPS